MGIYYRLLPNSRQSLMKEAIVDSTAPYSIQSLWVKKRRIRIGIIRVYSVAFLISVNLFFRGVF